MSIEVLVIIGLVALVAGVIYSTMKNRAANTGEWYDDLEDDFDTAEDDVEEATQKVEDAAKTVKVDMKTAEADVEKKG